MNINDFYWWLILLWNFASFCLYGFGRVSKGNSKTIIEFIAGVSVLLSFVAMFIIKGVSSGIILILVSLLVVAPLTGFLMAWVQKRLYGHYKENETTKSSKHLEESKRLLKALSKGMIEVHKDHAHMHPELQKYSSIED